MSAPTHTLGALALLVREYDEAIDFYTRVLRFRLVEDTPLGGGKRWVRLAAGPADAPCLLLARAVDEAQRAAVGHQAGGRVFLFLHTSDFDADLAHLRAHGVCLQGEPRHEPYGRVVVFLDLYGNRWDLIGPPPAAG
jgi:catechol 2,3-dioxygenase-like lactoylglutathione lyase family enzyme